MRVRPWTVRRNLMRLGRRIASLNTVSIIEKFSEDGWTGGYELERRTVNHQIHVGVKRPNWSRGSLVKDLDIGWMGESMLPGGRRPLNIPTITF